MPATITQPPIPAPNANNLLECVQAIRNALISAANVDAGRANNAGTVPPLNQQLVMNTPSQFNVHPRWWSRSPIRWQEPQARR